jgi:hypothetical protein
MLYQQQPPTAEAHAMHLRHQQMQQHQPQPGCDPRVVGGSPPASAYGSCSSAGADGSFRFAGAFGAVDETEGDDQGFDAEGEESGEEEKTDESDGDYVDRSFVVPSQGSMASSSRGMYVPTQSRHHRGIPNGTSSTHPHHVPSHNHNQMSTPSRSSSARPSAPVPVPVPNLTKKSRGRRVPTHSTVILAADGAVKRARGYTCRVPGCGKCFARGEHLKRHIRSIHTNEKRKCYRSCASRLDFHILIAFLNSFLAHKCPHPGCGKEFSRHDNLAQHMRVHRNYSAPRDGAVGLSS